MKISKLILITLLCGASFFSTLFSQSFIEINVSKDTVLFGNALKVSYKISNIEAHFDQPIFKDFKILQGPFTSSSYSFMNGKSSSVKSYTYILEPLKTGKIDIDPIELMDGTQKYSTQKISIYIKKNPSNIIELPDSNDKSSNKDGYYDDMNQFFGKLPSIEYFFELGDPRSKDTIQKYQPKYKFKSEKL